MQITQFSGLALVLIYYFGVYQSKVPKGISNRATQTDVPFGSFGSSRGHADVTRTPTHVRLHF
jgi:hypothetical protein